MPRPGGRDAADPWAPQGGCLGTAGALWGREHQRPGCWSWRRQLASQPELKPLRVRVHSPPSCLPTLQTLALELKKLYLAMNDKKDALLKAMIWPGKNTSLFLDCWDNLLVYVEHTRATAASRSKSLKAGLDYTRSYQVQVWVLHHLLHCFKLQGEPLISLNSYFWWHSWIGIAKESGETCFKWRSSSQLCCSRLETVWKHNPSKVSLNWLRWTKVVFLSCMTFSHLMCHGRISSYQGAIKWLPVCVGRCVWQLPLDQWRDLRRVD